MDIDLANPEEAEKFVKQQLKDQEPRLLHVLTIADKVRETAGIIKRSHPEINLDVNTAICTALLHDIGYADGIAIIGFHPIDGFNFLKDGGYRKLADLVVGHSCSPEEAELNDFDTIIPSERLEAKLVTYWDMRVKQGGEIVTYKTRLEDILARYGKDSLIGRANLKAKTRLLRIFAEIEKLLPQP